MKKKLLIAALLIIAVPSVVLAQRGLVAGKLVDEDGQPIAGVTVRIEAVAESAAPRSLETEEDGDFLIGGLNPGRYMLSYEKEGYEKANQEIQIRIGERNRLGDIVLPKLPEDYVQPEAQEYFDAGVAAVDAADYQKAVDNFLKVLEMAPNVPEVRYNLGFAYERLGDLDNAVTHYEKALELRPEYYDPMVPLADMHTKKREWSEAAALWKRAAALRPQEVPVQYNLGAVSMNAGDMETARAAFEKVLELDPTRAMAHYQLGMIAVSQAQNEEALEHLEKYLELDPDGPQAAAAKGIVDTLTKKQQ